jgi:hypothetical protein
MVSLASLWLPILLSAVIVFVLSSVIHMLLGYHSTDWKRFPSEDAALDALRRLGLGPGDYGAPLASSMAEMNTPEYKAKLEKGPRVLLTIMSPSSTMPRSLIFWFVFSIVVSAFAAYVASAALAAGAGYMPVFRLTSTVAFAGYALALWQDWIWYSRSTGSRLKSTLDGLIYALATGGIFGWLWPG